jgi:hypothetical protein
MKLGATRRCRSKDPPTRSNRHRLVSASSRIVQPQGISNKSPARGDEPGLTVVCAEGGQRTALLHRFSDRVIDGRGRVSARPTTGLRSRSPGGGLPNSWPHRARRNPPGRRPAPRPPRRSRTLWSIRTSVDPRQAVALISTRCTTDVPTPRLRPILRMPIPAALRLRIRTSIVRSTTEPRASGPAYKRPGVLSWEVVHAGPVGGFA